MMSMSCCSSQLALPSSTIWKKEKQQLFSFSSSTLTATALPECLKKLLLRGVAGTLVFTLLSSSPLGLAPSSELCQEDTEEYVQEERPSESVPNEELVEEAWEVVNESFPGRVGNRNWYPELWQGDDLLSVNGVHVKGKSAFDVSTLLQGPKGTFVTIEGGICFQRIEYDLGLYSQQKKEALMGDGHDLGYICTCNLQVAYGGGL